MQCPNDSGSFRVSSHLRFALSLPSFSFISQSLFFARRVLSDYFHIRILGWTALAGVAVVLLAYMTNYPLAQYNIHVRWVFSSPDHLQSSSSDNSVLLDSQGS